MLPVARRSVAARGPTRPPPPGATPLPPHDSPAADAAEPAHPFEALGVPSSIAAELRRSGITQPFPIQAQTLPDSIAGRDLLGRGRTGSGKTLAFALPTVIRLSAGTAVTTRGRPRALILAPTRELVRQINDTIRPLAAATGLRSTTVFGGVSPRPQIEALRRGVDIAVACPGRLEDLVASGHASLEAVETTVLDEADHMADLGFLPGVNRLLAMTPPDTQRLLFSATLDDAVDGLVRRFMRDPVTHSIDEAVASVDEMDHHVLHVSVEQRLPVLARLTGTETRAVVFARTKHRARRLTRQLVGAGVPAVEMHGDLNQAARTRNLAAFAAGSATTLVATDIAARGIHIDDVRLVIHADPPVEHKAYLHRSGRTARAGASGTVITIATEDQRDAVRTLSRKAGVSPVVTAVSADHALLAQLAGPRVKVRPGPATERQRANTGTGPRSRAANPPRPRSSRSRRRPSR
ncbi:MAG: DEAD/DEAH box helicase [Microthrixaceae bacterium]|nr:DEAD/DEAH box helicase [Microthrixaceae bacterium]